MDLFLSTPIEFLKGVGPQRADLLKKELNIHTFSDLLFHYPFRHIDRSMFHTIDQITDHDGFVQIKGRITGILESGVGRNKRLIAKFQDHTGMIDLVWFKGARWIRNSLKVNEEVQVYGRPKAFKGRWNIPHPEISPVEKGGTGLQPVYSSKEKLTNSGLHSKGIEKLIISLLAQFKTQLFIERFPDDFMKEYGLVTQKEALMLVHQPSSLRDAQVASYRLKFDELFYLQLELIVRKKISSKKSKGFVFEEVGDHFNEFYKTHIPFELTSAQKRVLKEVRKDLTKGHHMNRLIQGDVGSGKTLVALLSMLLATGNGFQAALMAPTEILAIQHFESLSEMLAPLDLNVQLLTGSTKKKNRTVLHEELEDGTVDILIGTHALLEDVVKFKNLGIVVIDEQHRFGVAQRARMWRKNTSPPHVLIMTATPIPRTLAMTFYGDLDVSIIDELPPGRKPITTMHKYDASRLRLFGFLKEEIAKGRQIYIVYPLIQESEKLDFNNLMDGYEAITRAFLATNYHVSIVHGKLKPEDKEFEMNRFAKEETHIMVATTVIEVGVNVPNASVMVIESAERFGLSQLHQLRGRVGRGAEKSYCILMTGDELSKEAIKRMQTMVRTNDGFEIAEVDLQLRGPGDLMGTQQSGILDLKIANLAKDGNIVVRAREAALSLLKDNKIDTTPYDNVRERLQQVLKSRPNWGKIA